MYKCTRNFDDGTHYKAYLKGDEYLGKDESLKKALERGWVEKQKSFEPEEKEDDKPKKKRNKKSEDFS